MTGIPPEVFGGPAGPRADAGGTTTLARPAGWFRDFAAGRDAGGPAVTEVSALNLPAVYSCVTLIATTIAALPLVVYRKEGRGKADAVERSEYRILRDEYNPDMTAMTGRETGLGHLLTWGNSYTQIVKNKSGSTLLQLRPLGPDVVRVVRNDRKELGYEVRQRGAGEMLAVLPADQVLHVPGFGGDGVCGYSPIRLLGSVIRSAQAMGRTAEAFATGGFRPPGVVLLPLGRKFNTPADGAKYRRDFREIHMSEGGDLNVLILEDGATWAQTGVDPESAQLLESRKFTRGEIASVYRVPPHLVGDSEKQTSWGTGVDEMTRGFIAFTLVAWMKRNEQEYNRKLFGAAGDYYAKHVVAGLLRGDALRRNQSLEVQHRRGIITDNEWRAIEDLNPVAGGDVRHFPLNESRVDDQGDILPNAAPDGDPNAGP